jgi:hypothetical protein
VQRCHPLQRVELVRLQLPPLQSYRLLEVNMARGSRVHHHILLLL